MTKQLNYNMDIRIESKDIELTWRKISYWLGMQLEIKDFIIYREPKEKALKEILDREEKLK